MIKKTIFILLFSLFTGLVQGQILKLGIKAGVNYANFSGKTLKTEAITSYHFGAAAELRLSEKLAIQPELLYSTLGASYESTVSDVVREIKSELGYVAIPVLVKVNLTRSVSAEVGPQFSFLMSKKNEFKPGDINSYELGILAGLGLKLTESLFLQARYGFGVSKLAEDTDVKNSVGQLSLGYWF